MCSCSFVFHIYCHISLIWFLVDIPVNSTQSYNNYRTSMGFPIQSTPFIPNVCYICPTVPQCIPVPQTSSNYVHEFLCFFSSFVFSTTLNPNGFQNHSHEKSLIFIPAFPPVILQSIPFCLQRKMNAECHSIN